MKRWLRVVLPPTGWLITSAMASGIAVAVLLYCEWHLGQDLSTERRNCFLLLGCGVIGYAAHRVQTFHPVFQSEYRDWLVTTPWTSRKALPLGPVQLVLQDGMIVGLYLLMA